MIATLFQKKTVLENSGVAVHTWWKRVPRMDTPDCDVARESMLELINRDPLSLKSTAIYQVKNGSVATNYHGQKISLGQVGYDNAVLREDLIYYHDMIVLEIKRLKSVKDVPGESLDLWLRQLVQHSEAA